MTLLRAAVLCFAIVAGCVGLGTLAGLGIALFLLQLAEGDGRGGAFVLIGFAMLAGGGLGLFAGAFGAFLQLRKRLDTGGGS